MRIRRLKEEETPPLSLLTLADPSIEMINRYIGNGDCFIAEDEGGVIGVYVLMRTKSGTAEVMNIAVKEHRQGEGIGRELILHAIKSAKQMGCQYIEVGTGNSSISQLAFYQKCGFRIIGVERDFFIKNYNEAIFENGIKCMDLVKLAKRL